MQPQEHDIREDWKRNFNIAFVLFLVHQRGIVVPLRTRWGVNALGIPCFLAFCLMCMWAAFSRDLFMWLWVGLWVICFLCRRFQAERLKGVHSQYDGLQIWGGAKFGKLFVEPVLVGVLGGLLYWVYSQCGLEARGLPWFLLLGCISLPFIERVKQEAWKRRIQGMIDARIEQEAMVQGMRDFDSKL